MPTASTAPTTSPTYPLISIPTAGWLAFPTLTTSKEYMALRIAANQPTIVAALRGIGASVLHLHQLKNCFDLLVGYRGRTFFMEIKDSS